MCAKLFKVEVTQQSLFYVEEDFEGEYDFDEEYRQLSFYSLKDGGKIYVRPLQVAEEEWVHVTDTRITKN